MNVDKRIFFYALICGLFGYGMGATTGYFTSTDVGSHAVAKLTAEYDAAQRDRDATINRITEDNRFLRAGVERAQRELDEATERASKLEEYIGSAGIRNKQITSAADGARQDLEEASRIIGRYLDQEQTPENSSPRGDSGSSRSRDNSGLGGV